MAMKFFRKHQKVILACITIGTMFLFIVGDAITMSARSGDRRGGGLWNWIKRLFGGGTDDAVAVVQGKAYDPETLHDAALNRATVYQFVTSMMSQAQVSYLMQIGLTEDDLKDQQRAQAKQNEIMAKDPSKNEPLMRRMSSLIVQAFRSTRPDNAAPTSMVEFLLLRNKADSLGVTVTPAVIKDDLLAVLGMNQFTEAELVTSVRNFGRLAAQAGAKPISKLDEVLAVLGDEVRVAIAKSIVQGELGQAANFFMPASGADLTPADLWDAYVKVKTSLNVGILPVKVEDYIGQVKDPSDAEVKEYFDKYKKEYPDPEKDTPGFRVPPMYRIGMVYADLTETKPARKHYNAVVDGFDTLMPYLGVSALIGDTATPAATLLRSFLPTGAVNDLVSAYNGKKDTVYRQSFPFIEFARGTDAATTWLRVYRPHKVDHAGLAGITAHLGAGLGQGLGGWQLLTMPTRGQTVPASQNDLLKAVSTIGAALSVGGLPGTVLAPVKVREGADDIYIPFAVAANALVDKRYEDKTKAYLNNDLDELRTKLTEYAKRYSEWRGKVLRKTASAATPPLFNDAEKQTLQDYLTKFAAVRGLEYHETKELRSRHDLLKEPAEGPITKLIRPIYTDESTKNPKDVDERLKYSLVRDELRADQFAQKPKLFEATNTSPYKPNSKQVVLHWVAEATDARTPDFNEAKPRVIHAWKVEKARPLAEQAAQDLIKKVKEGPDNYRLLNDMKGYTPNQTVARYSEPAAIRSFETSTSYEKCPIPPVIELEPSDLVQQCLDKLKNDKDMTVIANRPKDTYYLFYLSHRSEPKATNPGDLDQFHSDILRTSITRSFMVDGRQFRSFAADEKTSALMKGWEDYAKELTSYKEDKAKEYVELLNRRNR